MSENPSKIDKNVSTAVHSMCIAKPSARALVHERIGKKLLAGHPVIYCHVGDSSAILTGLSEQCGESKIENYRKIGLFTLLEKNENPMTKSSTIKYASACSDRIDSVIAKSKNKEGIFCMFENDSLILPSNPKGYFEFEASLKKAYPANVEINCLFDQPRVKKALGLLDILKVVGMHTHFVRSDWEYTRIVPSLILEAIVKGMQDALGRESAFLIIKTLKLVYGIDERKIVYEPETLVNALKKITSRSADAIQESISKAVVARFELEEEEAAAEAAKEEKEGPNNNGP